MSAYFVAGITIEDAVAYQEYVNRVDAVVRAFGGEYLAADDGPAALEGSWNPGRMILIRFPGEDALRRWYYSAEYRDIMRHRLRAARTDALLVHGH